MKNFLVLLFASFLIISCSDEKKTITEVNDNNQNKTDHQSQSEEQDTIQNQATGKVISIDKVQIGMTISEMKKLYPTAKFEAEPVYNYGVDGEGMGVLVKEKGKKLFFVWTLEGEEKINEVIILTPEIAIDNGIRVGMSLKEFLTKYPEQMYPEQKLAIDMIDNEIEFSFIKGKNYRVEFLTTDSTRVADYNYDAPEPEFIRVKNPSAKIDRISVN